MDTQALRSAFADRVRDAIDKCNDPAVVKAGPLVGQAVSALLYDLLQGIAVIVRTWMFDTIRELAGEAH